MTKSCSYNFNNSKFTKSIHSRFISFLSRCLSQCGVGEWGQPDIVQCQFQLTEDSKENARRSELLDLPILYGRLSSSVSKSLEYISKNVRISTISNSSSGRPLSFYRNSNILNFKQILCFHWLILLHVYEHVLMIGKVSVCKHFIHENN